MLIVSCTYQISRNCNDDKALDAGGLVTATLPSLNYEMKYMNSNAANQASNKMNVCTAFIIIEAEIHSNTDKESDHITSDEWYFGLFYVFNIQRMVHHDIFL